MQKIPFHVRLGIKFVIAYLIFIFLLYINFFAIFPTTIKNKFSGVFFIIFDIPNQLYQQIVTIQCGFYSNDRDLCLGIFSIVIIVFLHIIYLFILGIVLGYIINLVGKLKPQKKKDIPISKH